MFSKFGQKPWTIRYICCFSSSFFFLSFSLCASSTLRVDCVQERTPSTRCLTPATSHAHTTSTVATMILPGAQAVSLGLFRGLASEALQVQPCGVDLTLKRVLRVTTSSMIDFDNSQRLSAETEEIQFPSPDLSKSTDPSLEHHGKIVSRCGNSPADFSSQIVQAKFCIYLKDRTASNSTRQFTCLSTS